jgi:hypothetical protein
MFNADDLMEAAARQTGLTAYGAAPLREGLHVFCRALDAEAKLTQAGIVAATAEIIETLVQRLKVEEFYRLNPDTEQQRIVAPLMVTGLPRGGTTALSQMLSRDPALRSIKRWEAMWPSPPSDPRIAVDDARVVAMQQKLDRQLEVTPEYRTMLQVKANDPTEHYCYLRLTFQSHHLAGFYNVPSYGEWVLSCPMEPAYRYLLRVLKLLQVNYPGTRWNLKHPQDLYQMDAVAAVFPDALFIWNHRNPAKTVPSVSSLIVTLRRPTTDQIDKVEIGRLELKRCCELVRRGMAYRARPDAKIFVDIFNRDLTRDPVETIRALYHRLGLDYSEAFDRALKEHNRMLPKGKYGEHKYELGEFGIDEATVSSRFEFYISAFGLDGRHHV